MKRRNLAILIKSTYILAITFIALIGLTLAQYSWSTAWTTDTSTPTQDGNTIQAQHFTDLKNAIDAIYQIITFTLTGVNIAGDLTVEGSICDSQGNCVDSLSLECITVTVVNPTPGARWVDVTVECPAGYMRTGCSMSYNEQGRGTTWGTVCRPHGDNGCLCNNGNYGDTTCYAYCCRLD